MRGHSERVVPGGTGRAALMSDARLVNPISQERRRGTWNLGRDAAGRRPESGAILINGRFYGQPVTGVQRYGREIVAALDALLARRMRSAALLVPEGVDQVPAFRALRPIAVGPGQGHGWEQALGLRPAGRLLNLCNTGPCFKRRQVVCIHDINVHTEPDSYRAGFRLFYRALQPLLARRAARLATVSRASAAAIAECFGVERRRIAVLPNGHEHALAWDRTRSAIRPQAFGRPFVLLLGSRARHKNIGLMLDLAPTLDELGLDLVIAGGAARIFASPVDSDAARPPGNVRWLGHVSDDDLAALYDEALCFAFPSLTEGFGLPIVEAMALGCPVVSSNRASMPEVCGDAALLAAPDDPTTWLAQIKGLRDSPALREDLRGRGRLQARRFSWAASAQGYLDLLDGLA